MTTSVKDIELRSSSDASIVEDYIHCIKSTSCQIVAIDSEKPAMFRLQLQSIFNRPGPHPAELITSAAEMEQWLKIVYSQLAEEDTNKLALPLILLSPSRWPGYQEMMEAIQERFLGPIFLVDNSCAAANWAEAILSVDAYGKIEDLQPVITYF